MISKPRSAHTPPDLVLRVTWEALLDVTGEWLETCGFIGEEVAVAAEEIARTIRVADDGAEEHPEAANLVFAACRSELQEWLGGAPTKDPPSKAIPALFVMGLVTALYNAFVFCYMPAAGIALFSDTSLLFHACIFLLLASYAKTAGTDPGTAPTTEAWTTFGRPPPEAGGAGGARWDERSKSYRPDRSHYCRRMGRLVLRMDHHCIFVMNTIGLCNHKHFILFLAYASCLCGYTGFSFFHLLLHVLLSPLAIYALGFSGLVALSLAAILLPFFGFQAWLMSRNMTTVEFAAKRRDGEAFDSKYDCGLYHNITSVLGDNPLLWLLPVCEPDGDGLFFPASDDSGVRASSDDVEVHGSSASRPSRSSDGASYPPPALHPVDADAQPVARVGSSASRDDDNHLLSALHAVEGNVQPAGRARSPAGSSDGDHSSSALHPVAGEVEPAVYAGAATVDSGSGNSSGIGGSLNVGFLFVDERVAGAASQIRQPRKNPKKLVVGTQKLESACFDSKTEAQEPDLFSVCESIVAEAGSAVSSLWSGLLDEKPRRGRTVARYEPDRPC